MFLNLSDLLPSKAFLSMVSNSKDSNSGASKSSGALHLKVHEIAQLTPNMRRITLAGEDLAEFPEDQESAYVKLLLDHQGELVKRSYTVRSFDSVRRQLVLDFMLHGDGGPASAWANRASVGDPITISRPGPKKLVDFSADWFLIAGDMTALPAISVNIEQLPEDAKGYVAIEILSEADKQNFVLPDGVSLHWILNPNQNREEFPLFEKVKELEFLPGKPSMWVAGEFHTSRAIRRYLKLDRGVQRDEIYVSSYWHLGLTDSEHKIAKKSDID